MTLPPWDLSTTSVLDCRPCLWSPLDGITTRVKEWGGSYFGDLLTMIILSVKFVEYGDCGLFEYYISKLANYRSSSFAKTKKSLFASLDVSAKGVRYCETMFQLKIWLCFPATSISTDENERNSEFSIAY